MQLSVIIVNYNVKYFLEQCLCSVLKACRNIEAEIFVVDNDSTDGSREFLEPLFPQVNFIWNRSNAGFAKANNQALSIAKGNYILFLNPDTILPEDCFEKCLHFFKTNTNAGALGVHMVDGAGKFLKESKRAFPSPLTSLYKLSGLAGFFPRSKIFAKYYLGHLSETEDHEVDVLAGAFMMIPQEVLNKTGEFDEIFFMYGEDIDLSYRIQGAGYKNIYFAQTTIIHFKGESTQKGSLNHVRLFYRAMHLFVKKHYGNRKAGLFIFFIQLAIGINLALAAVGSVFQIFWKKINNKRLMNNDKPDGLPTIIVSDEKNFVFITGIIQKSGITDKVLGRIAHTGPYTTSTLGNTEQLPKLIIEQQVKKIIFCENGLKFKEIISIIQQLPSGLHNKFHASGSQGIVGSTSSDTKGGYMAGHKD